MPNSDTYAALFKSGFANPQHMLLAIAFAIGVYGPLIGSLVSTWLDGGREGISKLWRRISKWQVGGRVYLTILVFSVIMTGLPVAIFGLAGGFTLVRLAGQTTSLIGITYIYVWLYDQTQSTFISILFHALNNLFSVWLLSFLDEQKSASLLVALMPWLVVFALKNKLGKEQFPEKARLPGE